MLKIIVKVTDRVRLIHVLHIYLSHHFTLETTVNIFTKEIHCKKWKFI